MPKSNLTPHDWVLAGFSALADSGVEAVRVERLAKTLATSKGSFYWHFADRPALLSAMLDLWERDGTINVIAGLDGVTDPAARLRNVTTQALAPEVHGIDGARAEAAIRSWAAQDTVVAARVQRIEAARIAFLADELTGLNYDIETARQLGTGLYLALVGLQAARRYAPAMADDASLLSLLDCLIASAPTSPPPS